jgi:DsbC/DsbD-like thiol-disulfide interchange protein
MHREDAFPARCYRHDRSATIAAALLVGVVAAVAGDSRLAAAGQAAQTAAAGPVLTARTSHLTVQGAASAATVAPGARLSLSIEVTPRRGMHVYAPGKHDYQVVRFVLDSRPWLTSQPLKYPPSEIYHFVPLDERVETYLKPFTLVQDLAVPGTAEARKALAGQKSVTVSGTLEYQACDDKVCYAPTKVPLSFTLDVAAAGGAR